MPPDFSIRNLHGMRYQRLRYSDSLHTREDVRLRLHSLRTCFRVALWRSDRHIVYAESSCISDETHGFCRVRNYYRMLRCRLLDLLQISSLRYSSSCEQI
ncbi:hypothetical protein NY2A_b280L [Paramecium bursaria Chlorella virus NY2A]|uniref:Uncharacterized protein b280L n=1 Tax=Paramecium bursaria Chlorella virus NY2A TaxID=46021 RepID=A7IWF5_PBCVN|nr:hypothetical protein NY2A_b280L [Paramecium bursaria Chlorella virus NY2A]ABT14679.1 hypothetical protein NY2A_b280L [Paramecium bursaria Chlorella virus NY2A]